MNGRISVPVYLVLLVFVIFVVWIGLYRPNSSWSRLDQNDGGKKNDDSMKNDDIMKNDRTWNNDGSIV